MSYCLSAMAFVRLMCLARVCKISNLASSEQKKKKIQRNIILYELYIAKRKKLFMSPFDATRLFSNIENAFESRWNTFAVFLSFEGFLFWRTCRNRNNIANDDDVIHRREWKNGFFYILRIFVWLYFENFLPEILLYLLERVYLL